MIQFGIIGAGAVAQSRYIPALVDNPDASVAWVVDVDEQRANDVASEVTSARYTTEYADVLDDLDAVIISTPPTFHEDIARECLRAGVDILTEKPVALSPETASELVDESAERGVHYAISRQYREAPAPRILKSLVERGAIGPIETVEARFGDETNWEFASGYRLREDLSGGGVLTDKGPHLLDIVYWILGEELVVERYADDSYGGLEANAELVLSVPEAGISGTLEVTASRDIENSIELAGRDGTLRAEPDGAFVSLSSPTLDEEIHVTASGETPATSTARMRRQVDRFVRSVQTGTATYVPAESGIHVLEVIEDCYANRERLPQPWNEASVPEGGDA